MATIPTHYSTKNDIFLKMHQGYTITEVKYNEKFKSTFVTLKNYSDTRPTSTIEYAKSFFSSLFCCCSSSNQKIPLEIQHKLEGFVNFNGLQLEFVSSNNDENTSLIRD